MKKLRMASLLMALLMVFSVTGCGNSKTPEEEITYSTVNSTIEGESSAGGTTSDNGASSGDATQSDVSSNTSDSSTQTPSGNGGSLTWEQVKAKIPSSASGKTIQVYSWNEVTDVEKDNNKTAEKIPMLPVLRML